MDIHLLENIKENHKLFQVVRQLLAAINDWPQRIQTIEEFNSQVNHFINNEVNIQNIKNKLTEIKVLNHPWEVESLAQLQEALELYGNGNSTLGDIITSLTHLE